MVNLAVSRSQVQPLFLPLNRAPFQALIQLANRVVDQAVSQAQSPPLFRPPSPAVIQVLIQVISQLVNRALSQVTNQVVGRAQIRRGNQLLNPVATLPRNQVVIRVAYQVIYQAEDRAAPQVRNQALIQVRGQEQVHPLPVFLHLTPLFYFLEYHQPLQRFSYLHNPPCSLLIDFSLFLSIQPHGKVLFSYLESFPRHNKLTYPCRSLLPLQV